MGTLIHRWEECKLLNIFRKVIQNYLSKVLKNISLTQ